MAVWELSIFFTECQEGGPQDLIVGRAQGGTRAELCHSLALQDLGHIYKVCIASLYRTYPIVLGTQGDYFKNIKGLENGCLS